MFIRKRSVLAVILLCLITCGIYSIYWIVTTQNQIRRIYQRELLHDGIVIILLGFITCGIYYYYWMYKTCLVMDDIYVEQGLVPNNDTVLMVVLGILCTPIVYYALMQNKINYLVDMTNNDGRY
ncbi:MAG: DUF4234 domain-containing protein [Bacilli bacterium]|jgi:hypothetical protein|nr:DUF4234 domain-containing protein [Bacilli bacterium]